MSDHLASHAKPGTACLGCRRRKLKCDREQEGCSSCSKSDLPCVYPVPETSAKRKRGPYRKDKPPRERHLEDLVKYLEPKASENDSTQRLDISDAELTTSGAVELGGGGHHGQSRGSVTIAQDASGGYRLGSGLDRETKNSEDLVKDALIALTKSSVSDKEHLSDNGGNVSQTEAQTLSNEMGGLGTHPSGRRVFEYWHIFITRVDPLTKIIHCTTFAKTLFAAVDDPQGIGPVTKTLLFSIYYAAVSTCTAREARRRFGESRMMLLQRYARVIEAALSDNYGMPVLESLQALVIYIISIRREDTIVNLRALFSLAVRMAQLIGLQEDPDDAFSPFDSELRRRLWWHLCGLESRGAEEGGVRLTSIQEGRDVRMPANLNDYDLDPNSRDLLHPRTGVTEMTFVLLRWELLRQVHSLWIIRKKYQGGRQDSDAGMIESEQWAALGQSKSRLETNFLRYLHPSRPYDNMCIRFVEGMLIKGRLLIRHPFGQVPNKQMSSEERLDILQASVDIIRMTHCMASDRAIDRYQWFFRGYVQWHSVAIVIAELGWSTNREFSTSAWAVLEPILKNWDEAYKTKREEPAWDHVNALIERARRQQQQYVSHPRITGQAASQTMGQSSISNRPVEQNLCSSAQSMPHQNSYDLMVDPGADQQLTQEINSDAQQNVTSYQTDIPFVTGCAPAMMGFEGDIGSFDGMDSLEDIDFSAFDAVFGNESWQFPSPLNTDSSMEGVT